MDSVIDSGSYSQFLMSVHYNSVVCRESQTIGILACYPNDNFLLSIVISHSHFAHAHAETHRHARLCICISLCVCILAHLIFLEMSLFSIIVNIYMFSVSLSLSVPIVFLRLPFCDSLNVNVCKYVGDNYSITVF